LSTFTPKFGIDGGGRFGGRVVVGTLVVDGAGVVDVGATVVVVLLDEELEDELESSSSIRRTTSAATIAATTAPITTPRRNGCLPFGAAGVPFVGFSSTWAPRGHNYRR
jgi:hypothetical protein